ncbi:DUF3572 domain-containing protein [Sphingomonas sp. CGMCC 1.13654]|uniref:DUF3572 domain-containing protein n=1 Tax=Sphingomonas chungangi TaxID=2683589 RepID=A0A838L916_9SPHN|nr:DUF3572 domain-containing protein [Sphingomonas chungangi]MBA2934008.1 DUF3572 domain-containing protein [Sphingomonas chungangi]MVW57754.1 DUF3572 family protein [Sphingomonas chungangi]
MRAADTNNPDSATLALSALAWTLSDQPRAERLLALTGLDSDELRARATDPGLLAAVLTFLESHEPDLLACADALDVTPEALVIAHRNLEA